MWAAMVRFFPRRGSAASKTATGFSHAPNELPFDFTLAIATSARHATRAIDKKMILYSVSAWRGEYSLRCAFQHRLPADARRYFDISQIKFPYGLTIVI